jgi:hypothetical protein
MAKSARSVTRNGTMIDPERPGLLQKQPMGGLFAPPETALLRAGLFGAAPAMMARGGGVPIKNSHGPALHKPGSTGNGGGPAPLPGPPNREWGMGINQWQNIIGNAARRNFRHLPTTIATADYRPPEAGTGNPPRGGGGGQGSAKGAERRGRGGDNNRPASRQADMMAPAPDYGFGSPYNETDLFAAAPGGSLNAPPGTFTPLDDVLVASLDPETAQFFLGGANPHPAALQPPSPITGEGLPMATGIGWLQNLIHARRLPSPPRVVVDAFGRVIGISDGSDGFARGAYGGAGNDAFGFSGSYPGMGQYGGPNPGPNDPDYGYA